MWVTEQESLQKYGTPAYTGWGRAEADADARAKGINANQGGGGQITQTGGGGVVGQANQYPSQAMSTAQQGLSDVKSRYSQLLGEIKGQANQDVATEFGRRGIPTSSGVVQQAQGRETARRGAAVLAEQSEAELPFYQLLASLGINQASLATDAASGGGAGGVDWGSEFSNFVNQPSAAARPATSTQQPVKLNQANQSVVSGGTPRTVQQYSPAQQISNAIFSPLAKVQQAVPGIVQGAKNALAASGPLGAFSNLLFRR